MAGTHTSRRINALVPAIGATSYLEVGVAKGETFLAVDIPTKYAVDPEFRFDFDQHKTAQNHFHQTTSDSFFLECDRKFDVIFLDGLHVFEQTFRDFCNAIDVSHDRSVIIIDDTVPNDIFSAHPDVDEAYAERRSAGIKSLAWHGDIYKMVFALHDFFPRYSYCTISSGGNPQTVVWRQPRASFDPLFGSLEKIDRMDWFTMKRQPSVFNSMTEQDAIALISDHFTSEPLGAEENA